MLFIGIAFRNLLLTNTSFRDTNPVAFADEKEDAHHQPEPFGRMRPFEPALLPLSSLDLAPFLPQVARAHAELARFDGLLQGLAHPDLLLSPLHNREAILSSRIEGTQATLEEVLEHEADPVAPSQARSADIREVVNYRRAMGWAVERLKTFPLSLRLIRDVHGILLEDVRGTSSARGSFRKIQNFIGPPGCTLDNATYVPPSPDRLLPLLDNLEKYVHMAEPDAIIQAALIHAQFELIHPFLDGNGRVGRILIPLFLFSKSLIARPVFFLSAFLEAHRDEYYRRLKGVSSSGDHAGWINFFLIAVARQAADDVARIRTMLTLQEQTKKILVDRVRSHYNLPILDALFRTPIFSTPQFVRSSGVPAASANRLLKGLESLGTLEILRTGRGRRPTLWSFPELMRIIG